MDANGNIIPMTEDDQGEGIMDPLDIDEIERIESGLLSKDEGLRDKIPEAAANKFVLKPQDRIPAPEVPKAQIILVKMDGVKEGDKIGLYNIPRDGQVGLGNQTYKIQRIRSNGTMVLKRSGR